MQKLVHDGQEQFLTYYCLSVVLLLRVKE